MSNNMSKQDTDAIITFMSVNPDLMCIADQEGRFVKVSHAWEEVFGYEKEALDGQPYLAYIHPDDVERTREEMARLSREGHQEHFINRYRHRDGHYLSLEWHSHLVNNLVYASARDVTERLTQEHERIHSLGMKEAHVALMTSDIDNEDTFLQKMLGLALSFTESAIGYVFLYDEASERMRLQAWSTEVLEDCRVFGEPMEYQLAQTGLWGDVIRTRAPVVVNAYALPHPSKKGIPKGHVPIRNFLSVPIMQDRHIVALLGVANHEGNYAKQHVLDLTLLGNTVWPLVERIRAVTSLRAEKELLSATLFALQEGIVLLDTSGCITHLNQLAELYGGVPLEDARGAYFTGIFKARDPDTGMEWPDPVVRIMKNGERSIVSAHVLLTSADGVTRHVSANGRIVLGNDGVPDGLVVSYHDRTLEVQQEREIEDVLQLSPDAFCVFDAQNRFIKTNPRFVELIGYPSHELVGRSMLDFVHEEDLPVMLKALDGLQNQQQASGLVCRLLARDGSYVTMEWNARPIAGRYVYATARDVTQAQRKEAQLRASAVHDPLTGCYNRVFLESIKDELVMRADRYGEMFALILFDLDHFKRVNDTYGHPVGDEVLQHTARVVQGRIRTADFLVRIGGEEFMVLMPQTGSGAVSAAEKLRAAMADTPHGVSGQQTASFGVAIREVGESFASLYRRADASLYEAKQAGRNRVMLAGQSKAAMETSPRIIWQDEWNSGHAGVDLEHRRLVALGNELLDAVSSRSPKARREIRDRLELLLAHIRAHFESEEALMRQIGYPEVDRHVQAHQKLLSRSIEMMVSQGSRRRTYAAILSFLVDEVIVDHMQTWDILFFHHIQRDSGSI